MSRKMKIAVYTGTFNPLHIGHLAIMKHLSDAQNDIGQNANAKIVLFDLAIKLILLLKS